MLTPTLSSRADEDSFSIASPETASRPLQLLSASDLAKSGPTLLQPHDGIHPFRLLFALNPGSTIDAIEFAEDVQVTSSTDRYSSAFGKAFGLQAPANPPFFIIDLTPRQDPETLRKRLAAHPAVAYVEYDGIGSGGAVTPNDPDFSSQWHLPIVGTPEAWETTTGTSTVVLAVLDTGINRDLPDFSGRMAPGYDFVNNDFDPNDDHGHGSAVAAVAAGRGNNGVDSAGVDWNCRILPVKVLDDQNLGFYSDWAAGIRWATNRGAHVINLSSGGQTDSTTLQNAIDYAIDSGVIFITITHNDGENTIRFPGRYSRCITVGATQRNGTLSTFSNYGNDIDLVAPGGIGSSGGSFGTNIVSSNFNGDRRWFWGTSYAAPQVAGAACLLLSMNPNLSHETIEQILSAAADDMVGDNRDTRGFDLYHGFGQLNIPAALSLLGTTPLISHDSSSNPPEVQLQWTVPSNAASKRPLQVEVTNDFESWNLVPDARLSYSQSGTATLVDDGQTFGPPLGSRRFYRWSIKR